MTTKTYRVYGIDGHRQRYAFCESGKYDWSEGDDTRIIELVLNPLTKVLMGIICSSQDIKTNAIINVLHVYTILFKIVESGSSPQIPIIVTNAVIPEMQRPAIEMFL